MSNAASTIKINNTHSPNTSLSLIIHGGNNQICVDSRDIAKEFERRHDNVMQTIKSLIEEGTLSPLEFKERDYIKRGKTHRCVELNEAGFLKAMPFIGGKKSKEGQKCLIDEFLRLRMQLDQQSKERETLAYQVARLSGKDSRAILTDEIKNFVAYAKVQGSSNADRYFPIITNVVQKSILVIEPLITEIRELLTAIQLANLSLIELTAAQVLTEGMAAKLPYKEIYQTMKKKLDGIVVERTNVLGG